MSLKMRRGLVALLVVSAGILSACGGGGTDVQLSNGTTSIEPQMVKGWMQPADAVQDISPIRQRLLSSSSIPQAGRVILGPMLQSKESAAENGGALLIGTARNVSATATTASMHQQFQWKSTARGSYVGAISFEAEGANGVRLGVLVRQLPGSAILRLYSQAQSGTVYQISGQEVLQRIDANLNAGDSSDDARTWWTPDIGFAEVTLEIELPAGFSTSALDVTVPSLSHIFTDIRTLATDTGVLEVGEANSCNLDANCYTDLPSERNSVARMTYVKEGRSWLCTGTLLTDRFGTGTPYFLSANHCISSQTVASTLQTDWFYRSASCNRQSVLASSTKRYGGATLLYASGASDTSFMRLNDTPPAGAWFAGWDSNSVPNASVVLGLHHPRGDLLKISGGYTSGTYSCTLSGDFFNCDTAVNGNFTRVNVVLGITEGGSSGSALFRNGYVVGTLTGGSSACSAGSFSGSDYYGSFGVPYRAAMNVWLWPDDGVGASGRTAVYRFYNMSSGSHFFTSSAAERNFVITSYADLLYEGVAFYAPVVQQASTSPVFRFYNRSTGAHFYTISGPERDYLVSTSRDYVYEGPVWYGRPEGGDSSTAIYRFYHAARNVHFFTISAAERDYLIANSRDYRYEGIGYYAWTSK